MRDRIAALTVLLCLHGPAGADAIDQAMAKLDPEERAHQACIIKGMAAVRQDKKLPGADRMKTSIFGRAEFKDGTHVVARGGAIRAKEHWYKLTFDCTVTADQMKATAFKYEIGGEIPKDDWEDLGLWQ